MSRGCCTMCWYMLCTPCVCCVRVSCVCVVWCVGCGAGASSTGLTMKDNPKAFTVVPDSIELLEVIGRGSSSYVQRGLHVPSGTQLALKVINIFDKSKRDQLIKEIQALYDADCEWCVCQDCSGCGSVAACLSQAQ